MKKQIARICKGAACAIVPLFGACAWLPDKATAPIQETDYAKVNAIEALARARGVSVYWYRYPTKPVETNATPATEPGKPLEKN